MGLARLPSADASGPGPVARPSSFAGSALKKLLSLIEVGRLAVELPSGERIEGVGALPGPSADIVFRRWRGVRRLFAQGDIGLAASYFDADWASSDIEALIELGARNGQRLMNSLGGLAPFRLLNWLAHRRNANTPAGSRRNIEAHYDLGNEFYKLWLDAR
ncbi:MAG: SAM-dependent methyltransferase, partial [Roseiarcus sp.]